MHFTGCLVSGQVYELCEILFCALRDLLFDGNSTMNGIETRESLESKILSLKSIYERISKEKII